MQDLLQQTRRASSYQLYHLKALNSALALAGYLRSTRICGGMDRHPGPKYVAWFDDNVAPSYGGTLDGDTCYRFRCSMLHQGRTPASGKAKYARVVFVEPGATHDVLHNNVVNETRSISMLVYFVRT